MRNPFRSEQDAFRFLLLTIAYGAVIVIASAMAWMFGLAVFLIATLFAVGWLFSGETSDPELVHAPSPHPPGERRILVIANETVGGGVLLREIRRRSEKQKTDVFVVSPALNSPLRHWLSDEDGARTSASKRLEASLTTMRSFGIRAHGEVGDSDPLQAIEDALRSFAPDEVIISTHPADRSNWLERDLVGSARKRFDLPITHVVVDLDAESGNLMRASGF